MSARTPVKEAAPQPYRFTVGKFHEAISLGVFPEDARVELIDGGIFMMPPTGPDHSAHTRSLVKTLVRAVPDDVDVSVAEPVVLSSHTELVPDFSLVKHRADYFRHGHPRAKDVLLVIEVADTSVKHDTEGKALAYGRAGAPEYWVIDISGKCLHVFSGPGRHGYTTRRVLRSGDQVRCGNVPELNFKVVDLLL